ncbi:MAG: hypothetical protein ABIJ12_05690 [bacterium]
MKKLQITIVVILFVFSQDVFSQEIGILGSKSWTNNQELDNPFGFGLYLSQPLFQKLDVRVEFRRCTNQRKYLGKTYIDTLGYSITEIIKSNSYMNSIELSFIYSILKFYSFNLKIGPGISANTLDADKKGKETGRSIGVLGVDKFGLSLLINLVTDEIASVPLHMNFLYKRNYIGYIGPTRVATDIENPFKDFINISELQIGLSYSF